MQNKKLRRQISVPASSGFSAIGIGFGMIVIMTRWMTGFSILAAQETMITFGVFGGIGFGVAGILALLAVIPVARKIKSELGQEALDLHPVADYFRRKLSQHGYRTMHAIMSMTSFGVLLMQVIAGGLLVRAAFDIPLYMGQTILILFCAVMAGFCSRSFQTKLQVVQIFLIFSTAILLPIYFFVREGVEHIYSGIRLFHPYLFVVNNTDYLYFVAAAAVIFLGQFVIDGSIWQLIAAVQKRKMVSTLILSGLVWGTTPLSFSSLVLIVIYTGGFTNIGTILMDLLHNIHSPFLSGLFISCVLFSIATAVVNEIWMCAGLWKTGYVPIQSVAKEDQEDKGKSFLQYFRKGMLPAFLIVLASFLLSLTIHPKLLDVFFLVGTLFASVLFPMIVILYSRGKVNTFVPLSSLAGAVTGFLLALETGIGSMQAVLISLLIPAILILGMYAAKWMTKSEVPGL